MHTRGKCVAIAFALALGCSSGSSGDGSDGHPQCRSAPLAAYVEQRPDIAVANREAAASRALLDSCLLQLSPFQRAWLRMVQIEAADMRATALMKLPAAPEFFAEHCPPGYLESERPARPWERKKAMWEDCGLERISVFKADEVSTANFRPALWVVRDVLVRGGIDRDTADIVVRDASTSIYYSAADLDRSGEPARSTTRRPIDLGGTEIGADVPAREFRRELLTPIEDGRPFEVVVRSASELQPWAAIEVHAAQPQAPAVEVGVHEGAKLDAAAVIAAARKAKPRPRLRLKVDWDVPWQRVVTTIDALSKDCGGWLPFLEADPEKRGPNCPFERVEIEVVDRAWQELTMVVGEVRTIKKSKHSSSLLGLIEDAREKIESCFRRSRPFHESESQKVSVFFLTNSDGKIAAWTTIRGEVERRPSLPADVHVDGCIQGALGVELIKGTERAEHTFAEVTLGVDVPR